MKSFNKGRFARVVGAMGAAMLMALSPAAVVGTGVPVAYAQDNESVPVPVAPETETSTVEEAVPAHAPAPAPAPAPADDPVPVPTEDAVEVPTEESEAATTEGGAPVARSMIAPRAGNPLCEPATMWVSEPIKAHELVPTADGKWVPSGLSYDLRNSDTRYSSYGSVIAIDPSNTFLWSAPYQVIGGGDRGLPIVLVWVNVALRVLECVADRRARFGVAQHVGVLAGTR